MKVLYIISSLAYTESERKILHLLTALNKKVDLTVLFFKETELQQELLKYSIKCEVSKGFSAVGQYLQFNKFDIIHFYGSKRLYDVISQNARKSKIIETVLYNLENDKTQTLDRNLLFTHFDDDHLYNKWGRSQNSIISIHGVNEEILSRTSSSFVKTKLKLSSTTKIIGIIARTPDELDFGALIGLGSLFNRYKDNCKIIVGCQLVNKTLLQTKVNKASLSSIIEFKSISDDLINCFDIYLDLSSKKQVRMTTLEALSQKIPTIIPDSSINKQFAEDSKVYLYKQNGSIELLRQYCLSDKENVQPPLSDKFSVSNTVKDLLDFYEKTLTKDSPEEQDKVVEKILTPAENYVTVRGKTVRIANNSRVERPKKEVSNILPEEKVYYIVPYSIHGGAEVYLKNYLETVDKDKVVVIFVAPNTQLEKEIKDKYNCIVVGNLIKLGNHLLSNKAKQVVFYNSKLVFQLLLRVKGVNGIHITEIVHSYHKWSDSMHESDRSQIDQIICVSDKVARDWGIENYKVVPPRINEALFAKHHLSKRRVKNQDNRIIIGTVARFSQEKNLKRVVDIAEHLSEKYMFVIVGQDGGAKKDLQSYINLKRLNKRIILKNYTEQIEKEYATFDLFLLTSNIEGTPLTILEAQATGLPVVAPNVGSIEEMLKDQKGFLFDVGLDNKVIAKEIVKLIPINASEEKKTIHNLTSKRVVSKKASKKEDIMHPDFSKISLLGPSQLTDSKILLISNDAWDKWINYSPGYHLYLSAFSDASCDCISIEQLDKVKISDYKTVLFIGKLNFWDAHPKKYDQIFKDHIKIHIRNDLHSHSLEIQKTQIRHASYVDWITSAYVLSIKDSDTNNIRKGPLIPFQSNFLFRNKLIRLPHALLNEFLPIKTPLRERKDAILTGHTKADVYPFRVALKNMYKLDDLKHPGYDINRFKHDITHQKYLDFLGEYKISFADGGVVDYAVNKYIEVPFAGCILICKNISELELLGHIHEKTCFIVENPKEVGGIMKDIIKNPDSFQEIACSGQQLVIENHMANHRWIYFKEIIKSLEKFYNPITDNLQKEMRPFSDKHIWYDNDPFAGQ